VFQPNGAFTQTSFPLKQTLQLLISVAQPLFEFGTTAAQMMLLFL
jgi:hypothetical protein